MLCYGYACYPSTWSPVQGPTGQPNLLEHPKGPTFALISDAIPPCLPSPSFSITISEQGRTVGPSGTLRCLAYYMAQQNSH
jgi:hypothetical protein